MALQLKRGTTATLAALVPLAGEPLFATNTNQFFIGDGVTPGGILVGGSGGSAPNPFNQSLNTTDSPTFANITAVRVQPSGASRTIRFGNNTVNTTTVGTDVIAIGDSAARNGLGADSIAIGRNAAFTATNANVIAIGLAAGSNNPGSDAIAIGTNAGRNNSGQFTIAVGNQAGHFNQGAHSIAIGSVAGYTDQAANSIVLNAQGSGSTGTILDAATSGFFVAPVRETTSTNVLYYNTSTKEISYGAAAPANPFNQNLNTSNTATFARLGVNEADPQYALDVAGDARVSNQILATQVILGANPNGTTYASTSTSPANYIGCPTQGTNDPWRIYGESPASDYTHVIFEVGDSIGGLSENFTFRFKGQTGGAYSSNEPVVVEYDGVKLQDAGTKVANALTTQTGTVVLDSFFTSQYRAAKYVVSVTSGNDIHLAEILCGHADGNTYKTEYGVVTSAGDIVTFSCDIESPFNRFRLKADSTATFDVNIVKTWIE